MSDLVVLTAEQVQERMEALKQLLAEVGPIISKGLTRCVLDAKRPTPTEALKFLATYLAAATSEEDAAGDLIPTAPESDLIAPLEQMAEDADADLSINNADEACDAAAALVRPISAAGTEPAATADEQAQQHFDATEEGNVTAEQLWADAAAEPAVQSAAPLVGQEAVCRAPALLPETAEEQEVEQPEAAVATAVATINLSDEGEEEQKIEQLEADVAEASLDLPAAEEVVMAVAPSVLPDEPEEQKTAVPAAPVELQEDAPVEIPETDPAMVEEQQQEETAPTAPIELPMEAEAGTAMAEEEAAVPTNSAPMETPSVPVVEAPAQEAATEEQDMATRPFEGNPQLQGSGSPAAAAMANAEAATVPDAQLFTAPPAAEAVSRQYEQVPAEDPVAAEAEQQDAVEEAEILQHQL